MYRNQSGATLQRAARRCMWFGALFFAFSSATWAQKVADEPFPSRPIRLIVTFAAGGGGDILARLFAQKLTERWGQQVVVDNRAGAGGIIGADLTAKAAPNGYTYVLVSSSHTVLPSMHASLPYDTIADFAPVTILASLSYLLVVNPALPARSVSELVAAAKAVPQGISYASIGNGSTSHLAAEVFKSLAGINMLHVPYKGTPQSLTALLAGEVSIGFFSTASAEPHIKSGRIKVFATTGKKRVTALPDVPTMAEAGVKDYEFISWLGILAPAATPQPIIGRMHKELTSILGQADIRKQLSDAGYDPVGNSPEEFGRDLRRELDKWAKVVKASGAKVE